MLVHKEPPETTINASPSERILGFWAIFSRQIDPLEYHDIASELGVLCA